MGASNIVYFDCVWVFRSWYCTHFEGSNSGSIFAVSISIFLRRHSRICRCLIAWETRRYPVSGFCDRHICNQQGGYRKEETVKESLWFVNTEQREVQVIRHWKIVRKTKKQNFGFTDHLNNFSLCTDRTSALKQRQTICAHCLWPAPQLGEDPKPFVC